MTMYKRILVPLDGSNTAMLALTEAVRLAKHYKARLRLIHVVDKLIFAPTVETARSMANLQESLRKDGRRILEKSEATVRKHRIRVESMIAEIVGGRVAESIVDQATKWPADLIVMGTHGRRGINRVMMGSDAEQVIRTSPAPVLAVRAKTSKR